MILEVKPSLLYLKRLKARIEDLSIKELKELKKEVLKDPKNFIPFLSHAIEDLLKEKKGVKNAVKH